MQEQPGQCRERQRSGGTEDRVLLLDSIPNRVVTVQPAAHRAGIADAHAHRPAPGRGCPQLTVAARLGVNPNALYTYVASRSALEREIVERVLADSDVSLLVGRAKPWRERVLAYATALRLARLRHPGAARLMMIAPMDGPTALLVGERLIEAISEGGLSPDDAARAAYALIVQVLGSVALEVAETDGRPPLVAEEIRIAGRRRNLDGLDKAAWPLTAATRNITAQWISSAQFGWSVERLLDGIAGPA